MPKYNRTELLSRHDETSMNTFKRKAHMEVFVKQLTLVGCWIEIYRIEIYRSLKKRLAALVWVFFTELI